MVITLLIALLLPAVNASREMARRAACVNHLKQIGLAIHQYHESHSSFPMGVNYWNSPDSNQPKGPACKSWWPDTSFLFAVLPYLEQSTLYNAQNRYESIFAPANDTISTTQVAAYLCPVDALASGLRVSNSPYLVRFHSQSPVQAASTSYCAVKGYEFFDAYADANSNCDIEPLRKKSATGCITLAAPVSFANVTDGLSNTLLVTERSISSLKPLDFERVGKPSMFTINGWWFSGINDDTLVTASYPPNAFKMLQPLESNMDTWVSGPSSLHASGLNVLMADGSVRFIKESISSWAIDKTYGTPVNAQGNTIPYPPMGVWQKLATRAGQENIGADEY